MERGSATLRIAIGHTLLASVLVLASSLPVLAQVESDEREPLTMAEASAAALAHALEAAPSVVWPDAPVPASLAEFVPVVRRLMLERAVDAFPWPLHLRFVEARCNGGGAVALVFEEIRLLVPLRTYAYAVRGTTPTSDEDGWSGGTGRLSALDDPEFVRLMGADTFVCP